MIKPCLVSPLYLGKKKKKKKRERDGGLILLLLSFIHKLKYKTDFSLIFYLFFGGVWPRGACPHGGAARVGSRRRLRGGATTSSSHFGGGACAYKSQPVAEPRCHSPRRRSKETNAPFFRWLWFFQLAQLLRSFSVLPCRVRFVSSFVAARTLPR